MWRVSFLAVSGVLVMAAPGHLHAGDCPDPVAITGDREYGAYLAGNCVTCHRNAATPAAIPTITGWPPAEFSAALQAYRCGLRQNAVMQSVARQLGDDEIAALAAYFTDLE